MEKKTIITSTPRGFNNFSEQWHNARNLKPKKVSVSEIETFKNNNMSTTHLDMLDAVSTNVLRDKLTQRERAVLLCDIDELTGIFHYVVMPDDSHIKEAEEAIRLFDKKNLPDDVLAMQDLVKLLNITKLFTKSNISVILIERFANVDDNKLVKRLGCSDTDEVARKLFDYLNRK